jgi:hypothetical protein
LASKNATPSRKAPKPVEPCDEVEGERSARQVRAESGHRLLLARQHDHAESHQALAVVTFVLDVEIHAPVQVLRDEAR